MTLGGYKRSKKGGRVQLKLITFLYHVIIKYNDICHTSEQDSTFGTDLPTIVTVFIEVRVVSGIEVVGGIFGYGFHH